jgi:hypothetical protein
VLPAKALSGNPFDGHTLGPVIADLEKLTGVEVRRIHVDKGYHGHNYPNRFRVWITGQVRRVTKAIRREMRRRAAIEPVIGHMKSGHRMGRNYLKGREAIATMPCSPLPATTSACSCAGSHRFCVPFCCFSGAALTTSDSPDPNRPRNLHRRLCSARF